MALVLRLRGRRRGLLTTLVLVSALPAGVPLLLFSNFAAPTKRLIVASSKLLLRVRLRTRASVALTSELREPLSSPPLPSRASPDLLLPESPGPAGRPLPFTICERLEPVGLFSRSLLALLLALLLPPLP